MLDRLQRRLEEEPPEVVWLEHSPAVIGQRPFELDLSVGRSLDHDRGDPPGVGSLVRRIVLDHAVDQAVLVERGHEGVAISAWMVVSAT